MCLRTGGSPRIIESSNSVGVIELGQQIDDALADRTVGRNEHYGLVWAVRQVLPKEAKKEWDRQMRGRDRLATDSQLNYITDLVGHIREGLTVLEASQLIDAFLEEKNHHYCSQ